MSTILSCEPGNHTGAKIFIWRMNLFVNVFPSRHTISHSIISAFCSQDGIPDEVEDQMNLDMNDPSDSSILALSGYTYLEEYINSFYIGHSAGSPTKSSTPEPTNNPTTTVDPPSPPAPPGTVTNAGSGDWSNELTWQGLSTPGEGDDVVIEGIGNKVILNVMDPPLLNSITVKMGATLEVMDPSDHPSGEPLLLQSSLATRPQLLRRSSQSPRGTLSAHLLLNCKHECIVLPKI